MQLMARPSDDPFTVSMRETAKMEIELLNNQAALLSRLKEQEEAKHALAEEEAMRDTKEQLELGTAMKDIPRRSTCRIKNPHREESFEDSRPKAQSVTLQPPMMLLNQGK